MRLLITGARGMLGQDLARAANAAEHDVTALARAELDITDEVAVSRAVADGRPEVIINCAAYTNVDGAESAPDEALAINGTGAGHLAAAAADTGAWLIHISSDYVFDGSKHEPYVESDAVGPLSSYGRSKLEGEREIARRAPDCHTIARSSWLFGTAGPCFPATILRLAGERGELSVVDDQRGIPTFTGHLADGLLELAQRRPLGTLHVAPEGSCSWYEFAREIVAAANAHAEVKPVTSADMPRPAPRPANSVLGTERAFDVPTLPHWRAGLAEYIAARTTAPVRS